MRSDNPTAPSRRMVVIGTSGSGKTTLARQIAHKLGVAHVELDALHWEPNWTMADQETFRARVEEATRGDAWVVDGNYNKARDIVWSRAESLIWLDYPLWLVMGRIVSRTLSRILRNEELWNGNRESFRMGFMSRESIIVWAFTTYHRRRREYPELFAQPEYRHLRVICHRSPRQTKQWLADL